MSSIEVEPIDGPDEGVPIDGLAAHMTDSVGLPDPIAAVDDDDDDGGVERYQEHVAQRDAYLAEQVEDDNGEQVEQPQSHKRFVPLGAVQEERTKRQAAQAEAEQLRQQLAAHQAQLQQFQQWQAQLQQAQQQAQIPAFEDDPEAHVNGRLQQIEQHLQNQQQATVQRQQMEQAVIQVRQEMTHYGQQMASVEAEFTARHSDYGDAYAYLDAQVSERIAQQYPNASPEQRALAKQVASLDFLRHCAATGANAAEQLYNKARELGYQSQHRAPAISAKRAPTSLSNLPASGRAPDEQGVLSARSVANMSDEDFNALFEQMRANDAPRFGF
jgi:hypothetical protein